MSSSLVTIRELRIQHRWGLIALSAVLGALAVAGDTIYSRDTLIWDGSDIPHWVFYTVLAFALCIVGERLIQYLQQPDRDGDYRLTFAPGLKSMLALVAIIFACWLPYILLLYPGVMWYDTSNQLLQWNHLPNLFTSGQLTDHHPVFDTAIFGLFVQFGNLLGSGDYGIFLYSLVQSAITACAMAYCLQYMRRIGATYRLVMASLLFICLFPIFPMYSSGMVKDSLFLPVFVLFAIQVAQVVRGRGEAMVRPLPWTIFLITALLLSLTKKTGVYIVLAVGLLLLLAISNKARLRIVAVWAIAAVVMMVVLPKVVFPVANIQPGGKQEMLAIPFQQSARLMRDHGKELNQEQREAIQNVLGENVAERYLNISADPVKGFVWDSNKDQYLKPYLKTWLEGLVQHPVTYVEAYVGVEYAWLALPNASDKNIDQRLMPVYARGVNHTFFKGYAELGLSNAGNPHASRIEHAIDWLERTPIGMVLFSRAIWTTWITAFLIYECLRQRKQGGWKKLLAITPLVISYCSLWISPISGSIEAMRYMVPQVYVVPLACAILAVQYGVQSRVPSEYGEKKSS